MELYKNNIKSGVLQSKFLATNLSVVLSYCVVTAALPAKVFIQVEYVVTNSVSNVHDFTFFNIKGPLPFFRQFINVAEVFLNDLAVGFCEDLPPNPTTHLLSSEKN